MQVVSVGTAPLLALKAFGDALAAQLAVATVLSKAQLPSPSYAFNKDRNQYHCTPILRRLQLLIDDPTFVLGIADVDLFIPDSPFVFGESDREARAAVISVFRLGQNAPPEALERRLSGEALHQTGHLLGLSNCEDLRCAMYLATSVAECDRRTTALCNVCRSELAKLSR
jgi:archaemetzincin